MPAPVDTRLREGHGLVAGLDPHGEPLREEDVVVDGEP